MTVFRRFESKQGLVELVIARELRRGMQELDRAWEREQTLEERLVHGFSFAGSFVRDHPLFDRLLRSEPEVLLPLLTIDGGPALALYREPDRDSGCAPRSMPAAPRRPTSTRQRK